MKKSNIDANAIKALNQMKLEIANELGLANDLSDNKGGSSPGKNVFMGGYVGGHMTKKLVKNGEEQLLKNRNSNPNSMK